MANRSFFLVNTFSLTGRERERREGWEEKGSSEGWKGGVEKTKGEKETTVSVVFFYPLSKFLKNSGTKM